MVTQRDQEYDSFGALISGRVLIERPWLLCLNRDRIAQPIDRVAPLCKKAPLAHTYCLTAPCKSHPRCPEGVKYGLNRVILFGSRLNKMFFWRVSFVNYKIRRVLSVRVGRLREFWRNPIFWQQNEHNQVLFDAHGFIWLMIMCTVYWVALLVACAANVSYRPKISLFSHCFVSATVLLSAT